MNATWNLNCCLVKLSAFFAWILASFFAWIESKLEFNFMNSNMESKLMLNELLATERNRLNVTYVIIAVLKKVPTIPESTDS